MDGRARGRSVIWRQLVPALAVIVAVAASSPLGFSQQLPRGIRGGVQDCHTDNFGGRRNTFESFGAGDYAAIALRCRVAAQDPARLTRETTYANFYAGKAARLDGERNGKLSGDAVWDQAATALRPVVDFPRPLAVSRATPVELKYALTRIEAETELALVYRNAGKKDDALKNIRDAISDYEAVINNPTFVTVREEASRGRVFAYSVMAKVHRMSPANDLAAVVALQQVYIDQSQDNNPDAVAARQDIIETANRLGKLQLDEGTTESLGVAQNYFGRALDAGLAAKRRNPSLDLSETYVNLGRINMALAGRRGPDWPGGCDLVTSDPYLVRQALEQFNKATPPSSITLQWRGCAQMALGDLNGAVESFRSAVANNANTADTQVSLARALYRAATTEGAFNPELSWEDSRKSYRAAILRLPESTDPEKRKKSGVRVEFANVNLDYLRRNPNVSPAVRTRISEEARGQLDAANRSWANPEAYLRLAAIQLGDYGGSISLDAAENNIKAAINDARANGDALAEAHFLRSRLAVQRYAGRGSWPREVAAKAIDDADQAIRENRNPEREQLLVAQACVARLSFQRSDDSGEGFCRADEGRRDSLTYNYPLATVYEGMYFLRKAYNANNRRDQDKAWESAYVAFNKGLIRLHDVGRDVDWTNDQAPTRALLHTGRGLALGCTGLKETGRTDLDTPPSNLRQAATDEFDKYKVYVCAVPKTRT